MSSKVTGDIMLTPTSPSFNDSLSHSTTSSNLVQSKDSDSASSHFAELSTCKLIRMFLAASAGNFLEWYDFVSFALLADGT